MQDKPSARDLVTAVREFIETVAMPNLEGHAGFHARVAANALAIVERELTLGPQAEAAEQARLKALLGRDGTLEELNRALCTAIRAGEIDLQTQGLKEHLWETTLAKLAIDQPRYAAYRHAIGDA